MFTSNDLRDLKKLIENADRGPWVANIGNSGTEYEDWNGSFSTYGGDIIWDTSDLQNEGKRDLDNALLVAGAVSILPELIDDYIEQKKALMKAEHRLGVHGRSGLSAGAEEE